MSLSVLSVIFMESVRFVRVPPSRRIIRELRWFITPENLQTLREEYKFADLLLSLEDFPILDEIFEWLAVSKGFGDPVDGPIFFQVGRRVFSFSQMDFALVTGLSFAPFAEGGIPPFRNTPFVRLFIPYQLQGRVTIDNLKTLLENESRNNSGGVLMRKLVVLYLIHSLVLITRPNVYLKLITIVDDPAFFNSFPWGRFLYKRVAEDWMAIFKELAEPRHGITRLGMITFPFAIQAWVMECLYPEHVQLLASCCAGDRIPRILRWSIIPMPDYPRAMISIFLNPEVPLVSLAPTAEEEVTDYVVSVP